MAERLKPISLYGVHPLDAMAALLRVPPPQKATKPAKKRRAGKRGKRRSS